MTAGAGDSAAPAEPTDTAVAGQQPAGATGTAITGQIGAGAPAGTTQPTVAEQHGVAAIAAEATVQCSGATLARRE